MKRICVFTGSQFGVRPEYRLAAEALAHAMTARGIALVYGGARIGLMGVLADATLATGGAVTGVIPDALVAREVAHAALDDLRVVPTMHARKALMADLADAFIALPGGWGTFDELFEMLTWSQLGLHRKPVGVLNVLGYFDPLMTLIEHAIDEGFVPRESGRLLMVADSAEQLLDRLAVHVLPAMTEPPIEREAI